MMTMLSVAFYAAGVVLVVSGALKLAAPRPTSTMLRGLSSFTRRLPVRLIGIGELSLGMAALVVGGRAIAVLLTIAYLTFTAVSIALLRRGDGLLPCGCLGSRSAPASPAHVVINLGAALVAALAAAANVPGAFPGRFTAGGALDAALACLVAALIITFLRFTPGKLPGVPGSAGLPPPHFGFSDANSVQATRSDALAGSPAGSSGSAQAQPLSHPQARSHDVEGTTPAGEALVVTVNDSEHKTLLAFLAVGCGTCAHFWQELGTDHAAEFAAHRTKVVLVTRGPGHVDPEVVSAAAPPQHLTIMSSQAWEQYGVPWTPYFILIDGRTSTILAEGTAQSLDEVLTLLTGKDGFSPVEPIRPAEEFPRSWLDPRIKAKSGTEGRGLLARAPFRAGELVTVLAGLHATGSQAETLTSRNAAAPHPMMLDDDVYLIQAPDDGAAYASHSCDPNIWLDQGFSLLARREVSMGEELTIDYATRIADPAWQMACQCGSANCRGMVRGDDWELPDLQARYVGHFAPGIEGSISTGPGVAAD
jgi:hypothetical protein